MADSLRGVVIANGLPVPNVLVRVYIAGTLTLASIFSDEALSVPVVNDGVTGPLSAADGSWGPFFAVNGRYDIKHLKTGFTFDDADSANLLLFDASQTVSASGNLTLTRNHSIVVCTGTANITLPLANTFTAQEEKIFTIINGTPDGGVFFFLSGGDTMTPLTANLSAGAWVEVESNGGTEWKILRSSFGVVLPIRHPIWNFNYLISAVPASTSWVPIVGYNTVGATEAIVGVAAGFTGSIKGLYAKLGANSLNVSLTLKLRKNGADTGIAVVITAGSTAVFSDLLNSVAIATTDILTFQLSAPAGSGAGNYLSTTLIQEIK